MKDAIFSKLSLLSQLTALPAVTLMLCLSAPAEYNSAQASNDTLYIRDTLFVPLRSGQGTQYRILHKGLKSGTKVTFIENNTETGYTKIKTAKNIEGWIQSQYLVEEPTAELKLKTALQEVAELKAQASPLASEVHELKNQYRKVEKQLKVTLNENTRLNKELAEIKKISANAINLDNNNKILIKDSELMRNELDLAKANIERLSDNAEREGFINSIIAICLGVLIAVAVPYLKPRKRRTEWG